MDSKYQKTSQEGYFCPKRTRSDSNFLSKSVNQNPYRKPAPGTKTYIKKQKAEKYSIAFIIQQKSHRLSQQEPANPLCKRRMVSSNSNPDSWRFVPKLIKSDLDSLTKALKALLNKLTPTNLDQISAKISEQMNKEASKVFSGLLLNKACMEFKYNETYCQLAKALILLFPYFREDLLLACQRIFESETWDWTDMGLGKRKTLGLVGFIGELMNSRILSTKVLISCCELLIQKNTEQAAEGVCYLLSVCSGAFSSKYKELAHNLINQLQEQAQKFSSRIKFQVIDLIESKKIHSIIMQQEEKPHKL